MDESVANYSKDAVSKLFAKLEEDYWIVAKDTGIKNAGIEILDINEIVSSNSAMVEITAMINGLQVVVHGESHRHPSDRPNKAIGYTLAYGRAFEALARRINKIGRGMVSHYDNLADIKPAQRERSKVFHQELRKITNAYSGSDAAIKATLRNIRNAEGSWDDDSNTLSQRVVNSSTHANCV